MNHGLERDCGYDSCESQLYDSLPFEPPPDYDVIDDKLPDKNTRRWSVVGILPSNHISKTPKFSLETAKIKIPKTKLNKKHSERARSHSPGKRDANNKIKSEGSKYSKVVNSRTHHELTGKKQRPELNQSGDVGRMNATHNKQVRTRSYGICIITECITIYMADMRKEVQRCQGTSDAYTGFFTTTAIHSDMLFRTALPFFHI